VASFFQKATFTFSKRKLAIVLEVKREQIVQELA
jgi:hypothetical protein